MKLLVSPHLTLFCQKYHRLYSSMKKASNHKLNSEIVKERKIKRIAVTFWLKCHQSKLANLIRRKKLLTATERKMFYSYGITWRTLQKSSLQFISSETSTDTGRTITQLQRTIFQLWNIYFPHRLMHFRQQWLWACAGKTVAPKAMHSIFLYCPKD